MEQKLSNRLSALAEKATKGPWGAIKGVIECDEMRCAVVAHRGRQSYLVATIENGAPGDFCDTEFENAQLIVELVNNLPTIIIALQEKDM